MFTLMNQAKDLAEPREVDPLLRFQRMLFEEGNNPFGKVIQPPNSVSHPIAVVLPNHSTAEELLQRVKQLDVTLMLDDREFREHLKLTRHIGMGIDANVKTTFTVDKPDHPLSF